MNWKWILLLGIALVLYVLLPRAPGPCQEPLTYRLGHIDERFGLSRAEVSRTVRKAAAAWGRPLSRELFREDPQGKIEIRLIYDYRQQTADQLRQLRDRMDGTKESYSTLKQRFEALKAQYQMQRESIEAELAAYNARVTAYNAEIESWNRQGGVPEAHRNRLTSAKHDLDAARGGFRARQDEVGRLADEMNGVVARINDIAARQNMDADHYRNVGSRLGDEFQEGYFQTKDGRQSITIYHFENETKLVRLLMHELGHALGLKHSEAPQAVMYRLNQSDAAELTADDVAALKARCEGK